MTACSLATKSRCRQLAIVLLLATVGLPATAATQRSSKRVKRTPSSTSNTAPADTASSAAPVTAPPAVKPAPVSSPVAPSPASPAALSATGTSAVAPLPDAERRWLASALVGMLKPMQGKQPVTAFKLRVDVLRPWWRVRPRLTLALGAAAGFSYGSREDHPASLFGFIADTSTSVSQSALTFDVVPTGRFVFAVNERIQLWGHGGVGMQWGHYTMHSATDMTDYRIDSRAEADRGAAVIRLGAGGLFKARDDLRLVVELVGLDVLVGTTGVGSLYTLLVGAQYAL